MLSKQVDKNYGRLNTTLFITLSGYAHMLESTPLPPIPARVFAKRLIRNTTIGLLIIAISLSLGMWGYRHFEKMS